MTKLSEVAKVSKDQTRKWLQKQAWWQIYLAAPKYIPRPHWVVDKPNYIHQPDLLFLPSDHGDKYALVVVDVASRYIDAEPLTSKNSTRVAKDLFEEEVKFPNTLIVDLGKEFMGNVTKLLEKHKVHIQGSKAKNHRA